MDYMSNCIFIDESGFNINMNRSIAWTKKGASNITTLGTVAAYGGLNISVRRPKTAERSKEEKKLEEVPHQLSIKEKGGVLSLVITSILCPQPWIYWIVTNNLKGTMLL